MYIKVLLENKPLHTWEQVTTIDYWYRKEYWTKEKSVIFICEFVIIPYIILLWYLLQILK